MLYDLRLKIAYKYAAMAGSSRHVIRVTPRDLPGRQRTIVSSLEISPRPAERSAFRDSFGNEAQDVFLRGEHSRFEISVRARIERQASAPLALPDPRIETLEDAIRLHRDLGPDSPHHFRARSRLVRPGQETTGFALGVLPESAGVVEAVRRIGEALHTEMTYDVNATDVDTPHEAAFAARGGVCQDFSHIMIACLRGVGIPAGYVSGVLRTIPPPGKERLAGADAMHAWVRAWCGANIGWIEFDPTNAIEVGDQHIVVAYGRDYSDVSPAKGVLRLAGGQQSSQSVDLVEADSAGSSAP
ncbi:transglutaminase family protein [Hyphomonas sp.]|jgi:transglutaminase-like putative cysteine protease|uniref:transglutaminase family protein n=1 Tax=Hyphomonas sp. TaxID=87 RepID=UPI0025C27EA7|nr:transglutaminase family protein [Hyphomonas sp.]